jgi:predicted nuclease of predicted toxin-antitoxin system
VKLLVDAQLPARLAMLLADAGHDVVHTTDLPAGNRTTDAEIVRLADESDRIVVTKDHDFLDAHLLKGAPQQLLLVTTGNISNDDLITLFETVEPVLVEAFENTSLVEMNRDAVITH